MTDKNHAPLTEPERQYFFMNAMRGIILEKERRLGRKLTMHVTTFGCQMNAKDSEKLSGILQYIGYEETDSEDADFVLFNTCTVRENANMRLYGRLGYLGSCKKKKPDMQIALCGCMMQEAHVLEKLKKSYRFVDIVFGTHNIYQLAELMYEREQSNKPVVCVLHKAGPIVEDLPALQKYSFKDGINIMYGCNNFCSYCIVPYVRGRERSREPKDIISEATRLAKNGVKEVMLLGQNVNSYGKTLAQPVSFAELLRMVSQVPGIKRIRFMTPHPKDLSEELIAEIAANKKVCRHLHLPLQSGSSRILEKMNRHYTKEQYLQLVAQIREKIPDAAITTDIIVGFPGESEEDFLETLSVVEQAGFLSAYTFLYSKRTGTVAASLPEQVSQEVANERFHRLLKTVGDVAAKQAEKNLGNVEEVLVEEENPENGLLTGRLSNSMLVHFPGDRSLIGELVPVRLEECKGFYYFGKIFF